MPSGTPSSDKRGTRLNLTGLQAGETAPPLAVLAVGRDGKVIQTAAVNDEGRVDLPEAALKAANRILIGPAETAPRSRSRCLDPSPGLAGS